MHKHKATHTFDRFYTQWFIGMCLFWISFIVLVTPQLYFNSKNAQIPPKYCISHCQIFGLKLLKFRITNGHYSNRFVDLPSLQLLFFFLFSFVGIIRVDRLFSIFPEMSIFGIVGHSRTHRIVLCTLSTFSCFW